MSKYRPNVLPPTLLYTLKPLPVSYIFSPGKYLRALVVLLNKLHNDINEGLNRRPF